jgi:hypothetical protein
LPCPPGSIHPASEGGELGLSTGATSSVCQGRCRSGFSAPLPFGTIMYREQNAANRVAALARLLKGNRDGSAAAFGLAFTSAL